LNDAFKQKNEVARVVEEELDNVFFKKEFVLLIPELQGRKGR